MLSSPDENGWVELAEAGGCAPPVAIPAFYSPSELKAKGIKAHETALVSRHVTIYALKRLEIGAHTRIDHGVMLMGDIVLQRYIHIAPYTLMYGKHGITMGDYSACSAQCILLSESDDYSGNSMIGPTVPAAYKDVDAGPITIGRHVVLGARTTVLPGVTIEDGTAIGAHSLVKSDLEGGFIYAGVPVRKLRERGLRIWSLSRNLELGIEP